MLSLHLTLLVIHLLLLFRTTFGSATVGKQTAKMMRLYTALKSLTTLRHLKTALQCFSPDKISLGETTKLISDRLSHWSMTPGWITSWTGDIIWDKFAVTSRHNPEPHCWVTFTILPEKYGLFETYEYLNFMQLPSFIDATSPSYYFIIMTAVATEVQHYLIKFDIITTLFQTEVIVVDATNVGEDPLIRLIYLNIITLSYPVLELNDQKLGTLCIASHKNVSVGWSYWVKKSRVWTNIFGIQETCSVQT